LKRYNKGYRRSFNRVFTAFPQSIGLNQGLSAPQPDFVQDFSRDKYRLIPVDEINAAVLHKNNSASITLPHLTGEWKSLGGDLKVAKMQANYDGAALTYARNQALDRMSATDTLEHAHVTTFASNGRLLDIYTHHVDAGGQYHHHRVASVDIESYQGFKDGYRILRNAQDHAKRESSWLKCKLYEYHNPDGQGLDVDMCSERQGHAAQNPATTTATPSLTLLSLAGVCLLVWLALFLNLV